MKTSCRKLRMTAAFAGAALLGEPGMAQEAGEDVAAEAGLAMVPGDAPFIPPETTVEPAPEDAGADLDLSALLERRFSRRDPAMAYSEPNSGRSFTLDRSKRSALLRFTDDGEVVALSGSTGPRGDEFWRTDTGRVLVRVTELGNVILYSRGDRSGAPTAAQGEAVAIAPPAPPASLSEYAQSVSQRLSDAAGVQAGVIISGAAAAAPEWAADALAVAERGVLKGGEGAHDLSNIFIEAGPDPDVAFQDGVLVLRFASERGYAGRPSSDRVALAFQAVKSGD